MKGLNSKEFIEIVNFVQKYHKFGYVSDNLKVDNKDWYLCIKYIDNCYDTRTNDIWSVGFRGMGKDISFRTNTLVGLNNINVPFDNLYDWVMAYLKGEWNDLKVLKFMSNEQG